MPECLDGVPVGWGVSLEVEGHSTAAQHCDFAEGSEGIEGFRDLPCGPAAGRQAGGGMAPADALSGRAPLDTLGSRTIRRSCGWLDDFRSGRVTRSSRPCAAFFAGASFALTGHTQLWLARSYPRHSRSQRARAARWVESTALRCP